MQGRNPLKSKSIIAWFVAGRSTNFHVIPPQKKIKALAEVLMVKLINKYYALCTQDSLESNIDSEWIFLVK